VIRRAGWTPWVPAGAVGAGDGATAGDPGPRYCAVQPPSIDRIAPVTEAAASDAR
jgi:hypothetical protein